MKSIKIHEMGKTLTNNTGTTLTTLTYIELCSPKMHIKHYFQAPVVHLQKLNVHEGTKHVTNRTKGQKSDRPHSLTTETLRQK